MLLNQSLSYHMTICGNMMRQLTAKQLKDAKVDVTPEEAVLLNQLWQQDNQPLSDLARWAVKGPSTVTRQIDSLVKKGYVERINGEQDRRQIFAKLTTSGKKLRQTFRANDVPNIDKCLPNMSQQEYDRTLKTVMKIQDQLIDLVKNG